jgi:hypothetical protein
MERIEEIRTNAVVESVYLHPYLTDIKLALPKGCF